MGILRSQIHISDLTIIAEPKTATELQRQRISAGKMKMQKSMTISPELNLLGKTVDEALAELDFSKDCRMYQLKKGLRPLNIAELTFLRHAHSREPMICNKRIHHNEKPVHCN